MSDLSNINLNLLLALDALLTHCHVTRAATSLDLSQAAMSASLKQLRIIYQDDLLVRGQHSRMSLTPLAESLQLPIKHTLENIHAVFSGHVKFEPQRSHRTFHLGMSDYIAFVVMPKLMAYLAEHAPHIHIIQHAVNFIEADNQFEHDNIDLVLGSFSNAIGSLKSQGLFTDEAVIVADSQHPIFHKKIIRLDEIAKYPQVFASLQSDPHKNFIYDYMTKQGYKFITGLITPHTLVALRTLSGTQLIAHSVTRLVKPMLQAYNLGMRPAPYRNKFSKYHAKQYWHIKMHHDAAHSWLRQTIRRLCCDEDL